MGSNDLTILIKAILEKTTETQLIEKLKQIEKNAPALTLKMDTLNAQLEVAKTLQKIEDMNTKSNAKILADKQKIALQQETQNEKSLQYEQKVRMAIEQNNETEKLRTIELEKQIALFKEQKSIQLQNLSSQYGSLYNSSSNQSQVSSIQNSLGGLNVGNAEEQFKRINTDISQVGANLKQARVEQEGFFADLGHNAQKMIEWTLIGGILFSTLSSIKEGVQDAINLNTQLTQISMAMNANMSDLQNIAKSSQEIAKLNSANITDVLQIAHIYANINETADSIMAKVKQAVVLTNISGMSGAEASDALQGIQQQFSITDDGLSHVNDSLTVIAQNLKVNFQTAIQNISEGVRTAGTMASQAGLSFEKFASILGVTEERTRASGSQIANSLKMVMARISNISSPDVEVTGEDKSKAATALASIGVDVLDKQTHQLRDMNSILSDTSKKWDGLTADQKAYVSENVAMTRQYSMFEAIMQGWSKSTDVATQALNANGQAQESNQKFIDSTKGKIQGLTSSLSIMWQNTISSQGLGDLVSMLTKLIDTFGNLPTFITLATTALLVWKGSAITTALTMEGLSGVTISLTGAVNALKVAFLENPLGVIAVAFTALAGAIMFADEKQKEYNEETIKSLQADADHQQKIATLTKQYEDLSANVNNDKDAKSKLAEVEKQLQDALGKSSSSIDFQNGKIDENIAKIADLTKAQIQQQLTLKQIDYEKATKYLSGGDNNGFFTSATDKGNTPEQNASRREQELADLNKIDNPNMIVDWQRNSLKKDIQNLDDKIKQNKDIKDEYETLQKALNNPLQINPTTTPTTSPATTSSPPTGNPPPKTTPEGIETVANSALIAKDRYEEYTQALNGNSQELERNKALQSLAGNDIQKNVTAINQEIETNKKRQDILHQLNTEQRNERDELQSSLSSQGFSFAGLGDSAQLTNYTDVINSLTDEVNSHAKDKNKSTYDDLKNRLNDAQNNAKRFFDLQLTQIPKTSTEWLSLSKAIGDAGDKTKSLLESLAKDVATSAQKVAKINLDNEVDSHQKIIDDLKTQNDSYDDQIKVLDAKVALETEATDTLQKQNDLLLAQQKLQNVLAEKNTKIYHEGQGFISESNPNDVKAASDDLIKQQTDYNTYQNDLVNKHAKEALQTQKDNNNDTIKAEQDKISSLKDIYDKSFGDLTVYSEKLIAQYGDNITRAITELQARLASLNVKLVDGSSASSSSSSPKFNQNTDYAALLSQPDIPQSARNDLISQRNAKIDADSSMSSAEKAVAKGAITHDTGGDLQTGSVAINLSGKPEKVLSPTMTPIFDKFTTLMPNMVNMMDRFMPNIMSNFQTPQFSLAGVSGNGGSGIVNHNYHFDKMEVTTDDANSFLQLLPTLATQYKNKR